MSMINAVLFDLDGTLVDTAPDFYTTLDALLSRHHRPLMPHTVIREHVSNGSRALTQLAFPEITDPKVFETLRLELLDIYQAEVGLNAVLFPEMNGILALLKERNIPWGIVTNKPRLYTELLIERTSYLNDCKVLICADDVPKAKPHPQGILQACNSLDISPSETLYVGDHERDIQAAHNAGCISAVVPFGYFETDHDFAAWGANYVINNASKLSKVIQSSASNV